MAQLGLWAIILALLVSLYVVVTSVLAGRRHSAALLQSAQNGAAVATLGVTVAVGALLGLLLTHNFGVRYVYEHSSTTLPLAYTISALWAGQEGSMLVWLWFLSIMSATVALKRQTWQAPWGAYTIATIAIVQSFLALVLLLSSNPFARLPMVPTEGQGLNPLLQNIWMVAHPPVVFVAYATYTVPFALAIGSLVSGEMSRDWLQTVRRWSLWAWLFLGVGIVMGAWWAYLELGWGGYWGWDPVENSSLIPWLTGTALLHSLMMQRRRGAFQRWNLWLISITFVLCLFATFVTRSGLIRSVHAFGRSALGYYFLAFIMLCLVTVIYLVNRRSDRLEASSPGSGLLSREAGLLITNLLFVGTASVIVLGVLFPSLVELLRGRQASLSPEFYEKTIGPLLQVIVLFIGVCPWLPWGGRQENLLRRMAPPLVVAVGTGVMLFLAGVREGEAVVSFAIASFVLSSILLVLARDLLARRRSTGENLLQAMFRMVPRNRTRYGGHLVHLAVVLIAIGVVGSNSYQRDVQVSLAANETVGVGPYTIEYLDAAVDDTPLRRRLSADVSITRQGRTLALLQPAKDFFWTSEQWVTEVSIHTNLREDVYVILSGIENDGLASFRILLNPLVVWLWIGGALLLVGGLVAWWPSTQNGGSA